MRKDVDTDTVNLSDHAVEAKKEATRKLVEEVRAAITIEKPELNEVERLNLAVERLAMMVIEARGEIDEVQKRLGVDPLTQTENIIGYWRAVTTLKAQKAREMIGEEPFGLIAVDIDRFKRINDTYGHPVGDAVLKELVRRLRESLRLSSGDIVARCGGEEFRVLALAANGNSRLVAEKLRKAIAGEPFNIAVIDEYGHQVSLTIPVTISLGVAPYSDDTESMERQADKALYAAKNGSAEKTDTGQGRNQVWVWDKQSDMPEMA